MKRISLLALALFAASLTSGCAVIAVADTAATIAILPVKIVAKTASAAVDVVLPGKSDKK